MSPFRLRISKLVFEIRKNFHVYAPNKAFLLGEREPKPATWQNRQDLQVGSSATDRSEDAASQSRRLLFLVYTLRVTRILPRAVLGLGAHDGSTEISLACDCPCPRTWTLLRTLLRALLWHCRGQWAGPCLSQSQPARLPTCPVGM